MEKSRSFQAGIEAAKVGSNINNSHPFNYEEFTKGYKTIRPDSKTMLDECKTQQQKLSMLRIIELTEKG